MQEYSLIEIDLGHIEKGLKLSLSSKRPGQLFDAGESAAENIEARYQLIEGCSYDYEIFLQDRDVNPSYQLGDIGSNIVRPHSRKPNLGVIEPNIYVGTLSIPLIHSESKIEKFKIFLEVQSVKAEYRDEYRDMLSFITEKCTDLLLRADSPANQILNVDFDKSSSLSYQRFAFIKSILETDEFAQAVHRIVSAPVTKWTEVTEQKDIRNSRRFSNTAIKELVKGTVRYPLPKEHYLQCLGINSLPAKIIAAKKSDSVDTPENRFIKYALEEFWQFCSDVNLSARKSNFLQLQNESAILIRRLEEYLQHSVFKEISHPDTLKLNSPVLQRKEGYREVLRVWLMFDLAAKLIWNGGDDVYSAGKKDVATLYEYWLFFVLTDLFKEMFTIEPKSIDKLLEVTGNGLNLSLKQGRHSAIDGVYTSPKRSLNVRFSYNKPFSANKTMQSYPASGSWTTALRPDYTLSFWPIGISEFQAEEQELIVHIHFDAKYKIDHFFDYINDKQQAQYNEEELQNELSEQKQENRKGIYKNADLLKMHAYKDAIRRTAGAYVLYPGDKNLTRRAFHEIIPGLGAFPVRPSKNDSGIGALRSFVNEVIDHFIDRASQREKTAYRVYDIHRQVPTKESRVEYKLPEPINDNRDLIPDETFVLVGYCRSREQKAWIEQNKLYNFRMNSPRGSLVLNKETVSAKYLLIHHSGETTSGDLWKIVSKNGPIIYTRDQMSQINYPFSSGQSNNANYSYLVVELEPLTQSEFSNLTFEFTKLKNYEQGRNSALPFTTTLAELMKNSLPLHHD